MKKFISIVLGIMGFVLPSFGQSHDFNLNDREPVITAVISKDQVPAAVVNAVNVQFNKDNPLTWSKFPYALKEYGWVYDVGQGNLNLDHFEVTMKTTSGSDLWAVYTSKGELVESREMSTNMKIPTAVMDEFSKSKYKDWTITGNKEIIRCYHDHNNSSVEQHIRLTVEKDGVKRSISFNWQGTN
jgi:hypothetical protein